MSRPGLSELAKKVAAIKAKRGITYSAIAAECGGYLTGVTSTMLSGLVNIHSIRPEQEKHVQAWVKRNTL